ncbi:MAG: S26 family signal peptidase [Phycisphaerae bacterium]|nr:S26 family signal peptidase [Phycisphaerae bacterium]
MATPTAETNIIDTLQSLTVAFALAMSVRSFVTEGFVIPTGSMAPTLFGAHIQWRSPQTAYEVAIDSQPILEAARNAPGLKRGLVDPMLTTTHAIADAKNNDLLSGIRMGDRVLVLKFLYAFFEPARWDVVVFKNPTDPIGDTQNYIKRLIGLPNEQLLIIDGDIWTAPLGAPLKDFRVQRKPDYIQRAVWQPVHDSDFVPVDPKAIAKVTGSQFAYSGPPWRGGDWDTSGRAYVHNTAAESLLRWDSRVIAINDFTEYNLFRVTPFQYSVSDLRVAAAIETSGIASLVSELRLDARSHLFVWLIKDGKATLSVRGKESGELTASVTQDIALPAPGAPCDVEFWHVDQRMSLWLNGRQIVALDYDRWTPEDRVRFSRFGSTLGQYRADPVNHQGVTPPQLEWSLSGAPVTLHRVRVDRDLYYRPGYLSPPDQLASNGPVINGLAFGTDIDNPAQLKADQFLMLGDNSAASRDGRLWGRPHQIVTEVLGESAPFIVPRDLLLGKAWSVYFPSPLPSPILSAGPNVEGKKVVPPFGDLRFIR